MNTYHLLITKLIKTNGIKKKIIKKNNLTKHICAFRKEIDKSNIHFASEILNYIKEQNNCYIIVVDITKFFDNLNHKILKENLKRVLNEETLTKEIDKIKNKLI